MILLLPSLSIGIAPFVLASVAQRCCFPSINLEDNFPLQFEDINDVNDEFDEFVPFLNRIGPMIPWKPHLHITFCESLGKSIHMFVITILLCFKKTSFPKLCQDLQFEILSMCLEQQLLIAPVAQRYWREEDYSRSLRSMTQITFLHYENHLPVVRLKRK